MPYPISIRSTTVTGRVLAAEECIERVGAQPAFLPLGGVTLTFREREGIDVLPDGKKTVSVVTDPTGEYSVELLPGIYGMEIDGEPANHAGLEIIKRIDATEYSSFPEFRSERWPVVGLWPDPSTVYTETHWATQGIAIHGTEVVDLEVRLRRETHCVEVPLTVDFDTLGQRVIYDQGGSSQQFTTPSSDIVANTTATLVEAGGATLPGSLFIDISGKPRVRWGDVPPGTWTAQLSHPRYGFTASSTLTLRDWPNPGEIPPGGVFDASSGLLFRESIPLEIYELPVTATLANPQTPTINVRYWNETTEQYGNPSGYFVRMIKPDFADGFYKAPGKVTTDEWTGYIWDTRNSIFYQARAGETISIDGPAASDPGAQPDLGGYDIEVTAYLEDQPDQSVEGVNVLLGDGVTVVQTPATVTELNISPTVSKAFGADTWIWRSPRPPVEIDVSGARPLIKHRIPVSRALDFRLNVVNPVSGAPVEGALLQFYSTDGVRIIDGVSATDGLGGGADENGDFVVTGTTFLADYFVHVSRRGYAPQRFRFNADDAAPDPDDPAGGQIHIRTLELQPLQGPTILNVGIPFDRYGGFIPGVRRSGDQSAFDGFSAEPVLTTSWTIQFQPPVQTYSVNNFDSEPGVEAPPVDLSFTDPVRYVWLVDERVFEGSQYSGEPVENFLDEPENAHTIHDYLREMSVTGGTTFPPRKQYFQKLSRVEPHPSTPGVLVVNGQSPLWRMPPGDFKPAFVIETQAGAVSIFRPAYEGADAEKRLTGIPIPSWLGFAFDVMSVTAGSSATQAKLKEFVPNGKFLPFPSFTATIARHEENSQETNYIDYTFGLNLIQREGQDSPAGDVSGLAAGILGAEFKTDATITMPGKDRRLDLAIASSIAKEDIEPKSYEPKAFKGLSPKPKIDEVSGSVTTTASVNVDPEAPWDLRLTNQVNASIDGSFTVDLRPVAEKVPYVGYALAGLRALAPKSYKIDGVTTVGIGLENKMVWETLKPSNVVGGTVTGDARARRRHFLGGHEPDPVYPPTGDPAAPVNDPDEFNLCFRFGVGLTGGVANDSAGLSGKLDLAGNSCAGKPSIKTEFNSLGQWPPIKRISGGLNASVNGFVKTPIKKFEKSWSWNLLSFDSQFGTENLVEFIPVGISLAVSDRTATTPGQFLGRGPQTVTAFGDFALPGGGRSNDDRFLLWVDYDPVEDRMVLRLSENDGDPDWLEPTDLATGQLIRNVRRLVLPDGRNLVVWSGHDDSSGNPFAPESLSYVISDIAGTTWSAPAEITPMLGNALELDLVQSGALVSVVWSEGPGGPISDEVKIKVCDFDPILSTWGAPADLAPEAVRGAFLVLAGGPSAPSVLDFITIEEVQSFGSTFSVGRSYRWDGSSASGPIDIFALYNASSLSGYADADGNRVVFAHTTTNGMVRVTSAAGTTGFTKDNDFALAAQPSEMQACLLDDPTDPVVLFVWTELASGSRQLFHAFISPDGEVIGGPVATTKNSSGDYSRISLMRVPGERRVRLASWFTNSPPELRVFNIDADTGTADNDADLDGMNDLTELRIVDFTSEDGLALIDGVLPGDDFDNDSFTNLEEDQAGSDPTDPASVPGSGGVSVTASTNAAEFMTAPGVFVVERPGGDTSAPLAVLYQITGTATSGDDFAALGGSVEIPAGQTTAQVVIQPVRDAFPEGGETVVLTIMPDSAYTVGSPDSASLTIIDLPIDAWRLDKFGAQAGNPAIAGDSANTDADLWTNLFEYALVLDPSLPDGFNTPAISWWQDPSTGKHYLQISYTEAAIAEDLEISVESGSQLTQWNSGAGHTVDITATPAPTDAGGNQIKTIRDAVAREDAPEGRRFIRIRVQKQ